MKAFGIKKWIRSMALVTAVMTAAAFTGWRNSFRGKEPWSRIRFSSFRKAG